MTRYPSAIYLFTILLCSGYLDIFRINVISGFTDAVEEGQVCVGGEGEEQICKGAHVDQVKDFAQNFYDDDDDDLDDDYDDEEENDSNEAHKHIIDDKKEVCKDEHKDCRFWAEQGECEKNPKYMLVSCRISCDTCERITTIVG